jgi:hypothetical protein
MKPVHYRAVCGSPPLFGPFAGALRRLRRCFETLRNALCHDGLVRAVEPGKKPQSREEWEHPNPYTRGFERIF